VCIYTYRKREREREKRGRRGEEKERASHVNVKSYYIIVIMLSWKSLFAKI